MASYKSLITKSVFAKNFDFFFSKVKYKQTEPKILRLYTKKLDYDAMELPSNLIPKIVTVLNFGNMWKNVFGCQIKKQ